MIGELALVMSVKEEKAVILAPGGRFLQIKNRNFHAGQRILLEPSLLSVQDRAYIAIEETREKLHRFADRLKYKGLIILSSLVILVPTSAYAASKYVPWTYVSMDTGNVSIQYQLNARGEVLSAESLSDDAQTVIDSLPPVRFEKVEDAMDRALAAIYSEDSLPERKQEPVLLGVSSRFGNDEKTINSITNSMEQSMPVRISVEHLDWSDMQSAREENLSIGQYRRKMEQPEEFDKKEHSDTMPVPALSGNNEMQSGSANGKEHPWDEHPAQNEGPSAVKPEPNTPETGRQEKDPAEKQPLGDPAENPPFDLNIALTENTDMTGEDIVPAQQIPDEKGSEPPFPSGAPQQNEMISPEGGVPEEPAKQENSADSESFMIAPPSHGTEEDRSLPYPGQTSEREAPPSGNPNDGNPFFPKP